MAARRGTARRKRRQDVKEPAGMWLCRSAFWRVGWCRSFILHNLKTLRPHPPVQRLIWRRPDFLLAFNWEASITYLVIPSAKPFVQAIGIFSVEINDDRLFPGAASDVSRHAVGFGDHCVFELWHRCVSFCPAPLLGHITKHNMSFSYEHNNFRAPFGPLFLRSDGCFRFRAGLVEWRRCGAARGDSPGPEKRRAVLRAGRRAVAEGRFGSRRRFTPFGPAAEARLRRGAQRARTRAWRARADRGRDQFVPRGGSIAPRFRRSPRQSRPGLAAKRRTRRRDRRASRGCRSSTQFGRVPQRLRIRARAERPSRRGRRRIRICREARSGFSRGTIPPGRDSVVATAIRRRHRAAAHGNQTQTGSRRIALLPRHVAAEDGPTARGD